MPKRIMPLTDMKVRKAKPKDKVSYYSMVAVYSLWLHHPAVSYGVLNIDLMGRKRNLLLAHIRK